MKQIPFAAAAFGKKKALPQQPCASAEDNQWARQIPGNGYAGARRLVSAIDRKWVHLGYVVIDVGLVSFNGFLAYCLLFVPSSLVQILHSGQLRMTADFPWRPYCGYLLVYAILVVLVCQSQDLYRTRRGRSTLQESWAVIRAVTLATFLLAAFIYCSNVNIISRGLVGVSGLLNIVALVMWRIWKRQFVTKRVAQGIGSINVLIVGAREVGQALAHYLELNKQLGYRVAGFLDSEDQGGARNLGRIEELARVARAQFADEVFVTIPSDREVVKRIAADARRQRLNVKVVPDLYDGLAWNVPIQHLGHFPLMELHWEPIPVVGLFFKRLCDLVASFVGLILSWPLFVLISIAVRLDSPGPALHKSSRIGRKGRTFTCYKFRTMVANAEELKPQLNHLNERSNGLLFKIEKDPRVTRLGKFLRRYSLDELPQLWNVLKGEMSLVGPRPPLPTEFNQYSLEHLRRLDVRPGITGLWQISARLDPSFENYMALDLEYIESWSLWKDVKILWKTIPAVLKGEGR